MYMTAQHIAEQGGHFEPQRANNAIMVIEALPGWNTETTDVALSLDTFPLPKETNSAIDLNWQNERRRVLGPVNVENMEVVFKDFVDRSVALTLLRWRRMVYQPESGNDGLPLTPVLDGAVGLAANYKRAAKLFLCAPDGSTERTWRLEGVWPSAMDPGDIDMASEDIVKIRMTLIIDRVAEVSLNPREESFAA